MSYIRF
jgi:hypothetical protein